MKLFKVPVTLSTCREIYQSRALIERVLEPLRSEKGLEALSEWIIVRFSSMIDGWIRSTFSDHWNVYMRHERKKKINDGARETHLLGFSSALGNPLLRFVPCLIQCK